MVQKSEGRNPKTERTPKTKIRNEISRPPDAFPGLRNSEFGFLSDFAIRISDLLLMLLRQMRVCLQPFPHELVEFLTRRLMFDALDDFAGEGVNQHPPRR